MQNVPQKLLDFAAEEKFRIWVACGFTIKNKKDGMLIVFGLKNSK